MDAENKKLASEAKDLLSRGLFGPAIAAAREVLKDCGEKGTVADMHAVCAIALIGTGRNAEGVEQADLCLAVKADRADVLSARGWAMHMQGKTTEGLKNLEKASLLDAGDAETHYRLGIAFMELDLWEEADGAFSAALEIFSEDDRRAEACYNRARCREGGGLIEEAMADYDEAFGLGYQQAIHDLMRLREKYGSEDDDEDDIYEGDDLYGSDGEFSDGDYYDGDDVDGYSNRNDDW